MMNKTMMIILTFFSSSLIYADDYPLLGMKLTINSSDLNYVTSTIKDYDYTGLGMKEWSITGSGVGAIDASISPCNIYGGCTTPISNNRRLDGFSFNFKDVAEHKDFYKECERKFSDFSKATQLAKSTGSSSRSQYILEVMYKKTGIYKNTYLYNFANIGSNKKINVNVKAARHEVTGNTNPIVPVKCYLRNNF